MSNLHEHIGLLLILLGMCLFSVGVSVVTNYILFFKVNKEPNANRPAAVKPYVGNRRSTRTSRTDTRIENF